MNEKSRAKLRKHVNENDLTTVAREAKVAPQTLAKALAGMSVNRSIESALETFAAGL